MSAICFLESERDTAWREHCRLSSESDEFVLQLFLLASEGPPDEAKACGLLSGYDCKAEGAAEALSRFVCATHEIERQLLRQHLSRVRGA